MIRIDNLAPPPFFESPDFRAQRDQLFEYLRLSPADRGQRRAPIDDELFFSRSLREPVLSRSYNKCAFCERIDNHIVTHFRPLRNPKDLGDEDEPGHEDHYAWLAYEWDNLLALCSECARAKGQFFPVEDERAPYLASLIEVRRLERASFIDPLHDNPDRHFDFLMDGWCEPLTPKGRTTANIIGLNRPSLVTDRQAKIHEMERELVAWLGGDKSLADVFDDRRDFLGSRLNVLKRLLLTVPARGARIVGKPRALPGLVEQHIKALDQGFAKRVVDALGALRQEDADRPRTEMARGRPPYASHAQVKATSSKPRPQARQVSDVTLTDFKGFGSITLASKTERETSYGAPCLMLLGENSAGKSTILQAIALALLGGSQARRLRLDPDDYLRSGSAGRWDQLSPKSAIADVGFRYEDTRATFTLDGRSRKIVGAGSPAALVLAYGARRYFDRKRSRRPTGAYGRVRTLFDPLATIPYPGTWLNGLIGTEFDEVAGVLREILSLNLKDDLVQDQNGRICLVVDGTPAPVPVERLSEGYRSVFTMVADIARELLDHYSLLLDAEAVVLIDEIETHLHPRWKMRVMRSLRRALPKVQFIVTTHDPLCLRGMEDGEVIVLQRDANGRIVALKDLPSLKGMRAEQLLTSEYFGLASTVDPQTELDLARFTDSVARNPLDKAGATMSRLVLGDTAAEQVVQQALQTFIKDWEDPTKGLRSDLRADAVAAVLNALEQPEAPAREQL